MKACFDTPAQIKECLNLTDAYQSLLEFQCPESPVATGGLSELGHLRDLGTVGIGLEASFDRRQGPQISGLTVAPRGFLRCAGCY